MSRATFSMTIDPEGAMHDWVDLPPGWSLEAIPTQELVPLLGIPAYQALLIDHCECERPDLLVVHPPYDYLDPPTAATIRAAGTALVGYAFDDEIFAQHYSPATWTAIRGMFDRYCTTREVRWATAPLPALPRCEPEHEVVLVGRAYARRQELVAALTAAGIRVTTAGLGWPAGFVSRVQMLELYSRAAVVLTTADWEHHPVPMVKHRLLDTAMLGVFQVAQAAPDLRGYFPEHEVPAFSTPDELVFRVQDALDRPAWRLQAAAAARARALTEHTWQVRFPELLQGVPLRPEAVPTSRQRSRLLDQALLALASRAEADRRYGAAAALARRVLTRDPTQPTAAAILGRGLRDLGEPEAALPWLQQAARIQPPTCAGALRGALPPFGVGTGLGRFGLLPPAAEPLVYLLATQIELGRYSEAEQTWDALTEPALRRAVAASLDLGPPAADPALAGLRRRLEAARAKE